MHIVKYVGKGGAGTATAWYTRSSTIQAGSAIHIVWHPYIVPEGTPEGMHCAQNIRKSCTLEVPGKEDIIRP